MRRGRVAQSRSAKLATDMEAVVGASADELLDVLAKSGQSVEEAERAVLDAVVATPSSVLTSVQKVVDDWQQSGAADLFKDEHMSTMFYKATMAGLLVRYAGLLTKTLQLLNDKLDDSSLGATQVLAMSEKLSEQFVKVREQVAFVDKDFVPPASLAELERRLAQAESVPRADDSEPVDMPDTSDTDE